MAAPLVYVQIDGGFVAIIVAEFTPQFEWAHNANVQADTDLKYASIRAGFVGVRSAVFQRGVRRVVGNAATDADPGIEGRGREKSYSGRWCDVVGTEILRHGVAGCEGHVCGG